MERKKYKQIRVIAAMFIGVVVAGAVGVQSYWLALAAVATGMFFMGIVRAKAGIKTDEREEAVREKAAQATYAIFAPTIGLGSFFLMMLAQKKEFYFIEALGMVFAYLTLFMLVLYAISYHFFNRKYGGSGDEE